ncbi:MAG: hypothetical protein RLZZ324_72 [Candidatus Parcubacteria bacterium]
MPTYRPFRDAVIRPWPAADGGMLAADVDAHKVATAVRAACATAAWQESQTARGDMRRLGPTSGAFAATTAALDKSLGMLPDICQKVEFAASDSEVVAIANDSYMKYLRSFRDIGTAMDADLRRAGFQGSADEWQDVSASYDMTKGVIR